MIDVIDRGLERLDRVCESERESDRNMTPEELRACVDAVTTNSGTAQFLACYFERHAWEFDLELLRIFFAFYEPENEINVGVREAMSCVVLEILRYPAQNLCVIEFLIENGFHFLLWNWFPELMTVELFRELIPVSVDVLNFVLEAEIIEKIMSSLSLCDEEFVCRMIFLVSAFKRYKNTYAILKPLLVGISETALQNLGQPRCFSGLTVLGQFAHTSSEIAFSILANVEFQKGISASTSTISDVVPAFVKFLEHSLITPFHNVATELPSDFVASVAQLLRLSLAFVDDSTILSSVRVLKHIISSQERLCIFYEFGIIENLLNIMHSSHDFPTMAATFECLCHTMKFADISQIDYIVSHGFFDLLNIYIDSMLTDNELEFIDWIMRFESICVAHAKYDWLRHVFSNQSITDAVIDNEDITGELRHRIHEYVE